MLDDVADEGDEGQHPMDEAQSDADKAATAKQEAVDKLVQDETYFLPINSVEKRRAKHMLWVTLLLFVVLGVAAAAWASARRLPQAIRWRPCTAAGSR